MRTPILRSAVTRVAAACALAFGASACFGAGFQLNETSASGLGNAFAGGAAVAEDASTLWSNVAGISRIKTAQVVGTIHLITPSLRFRNDGSLPAAGQALGGDGGDAGGLNVVPNLYVVKPIDSIWSAGIGFNAPWGLVTEYDPGWTGRFQAIKSSIKTYNLNPGVSWKPSSNLALGLGLNLQRMTAEFTNQVNYSGALLSAAALKGVAPGSATFNAIAAATAGLESGARIKGSDNAAGWNAGLLWELDDKTRLGMQYRSSVKYRISGDVRFSNPTPVLAGPLAPTVAALAGGVNAGALFNSGVTADVKIPAIVNLSWFTAVNDRWDFMTDAQWTRWSTIQTLTFVRANGAVLQSTPENFRNSWKLAFGANYHYNDQWMWRGGLAFDQSPVRTAFRTPRLPDGDRTWLTAGAQYTVNPKLKIDFGAAYLFVKNATINNAGNPSSVSAYSLLNGHYDSNTVIVSAQLKYDF